MELFLIKDERDDLIELMDPYYIEVRGNSHQVEEYRLTHIKTTAVQVQNIKKWLLSYIE
jgi:hypothetical protein